VLGNEVRSRVERVPARTVERDRSLQSRRGLVDPMMYLADDREPNRLYVFASAAGADTNPAWFHNLIAHPEEVRVEVGSDTMTATAEVLPDARRGEVYAVQASRYPGFANYQAKTTRLIPVIALTLHR
jgi:deazaflavin-dependent oxidoreductase (nitroreductase family)